MDSEVPIVGAGPTGLTLAIERAIRSPGRAGDRARRARSHRPRHVRLDPILLRPDLHVVWRGNAAPENAAEVAAIATGHFEPD